MILYIKPSSKRIMQHGHPNKNSSNAKYWKQYSVDKWNREFGASVSAEDIKIRYKSEGAFSGTLTVKLA